MKKLKELETGCLVLAMLALVLAGCPMNPEDNDAASVTAITVAGVAVTTLPAPVPQSEWAGLEGLVDLEDGQIGEVVLSQTSALTDARISVTPSAGAQVTYAAAEYEPPAEFQAESTITLANNGYLVIRVRSEDGKNVNYYVVEIKVAATITSLTGVTVGGIQGNLGTPNANLAQITAGSVGLSNGTKTGAHVVVTKANAKQTVKFAKVTGDAAPEFADTDTFNFEDGDFLYIEVTAENGTDKGFYKLEVQVGRDTTLTSITIGGIPVTISGNAAGTIENPITGTVLFNTLQPEGGYTVAITPTDNEAHVVWAAVSAGASAPEAASFNTTSPVVFSDQGYLYVKVTAANNTTIAFYKIRVNLMMTATIGYGQPQIKASAEHYIDPLWAGVTETYAIAKVFGADSTDAYKANPTTTGVAKALFDESGLYVYVEVTDPAVDVSSTGAHTKDSVELFINEGVDGQGNLLKTPQSYSEKGGQYRVNAAGETSGDPGAAGTALAALNKVSAWATDTGYVVIFQAPWRFTESYPLADNKKIGFELQINACSGGNRDGVMVWNNIAHTNYQNVTDYGEATLDLGDHVLAVNAKSPSISSHPAGALYTSGGTAAALTVSAASPDGGTLSYQWYSNTTSGYEGGTAISGQTGASYTPDISADGSKYYWVVVTNTITDNNDGGTKTAALRSGMATIVVSSVPLVEKIEAAASSVPVYRFTPPAGKTWSDYKKMTFTVLVADDASYNHVSARAHIVGNYPESNFTSGGVYTSGDWGSQRLVIIEAGDGDATIKGVLENPGLNTWKKLEYPIDTPPESGYTTATYYPAAAAAGPFYFGLGFTLNPNNLANDAKGDLLEYYIKDVALVEANGTTLSADDLFDAVGNTTLGQLWCKFNVDHGNVIRTMEPDPAEK
jgi:hypothetical protein